MKRLLAAFALILLAAAPALILIAPVPARAANIQNIDLGKKAEVWFAEDHTVPIISFNISLPAGSAYDPAGKAGLAAFAGAMIDEGAGGLDSKSFHEALANRAITFSARAERDYLVITISTLKENAPEAMHLLQLALTRPRFENEAIQKVRAQIIQSLEQDQAEPQRLAARGFMREFFGGHAYAHPVSGEIASISSVTAADLRNFARGHWVKSGLKVAVAGDITAPALTKLLGETFLPVSGGSPPPLPNVGRLGAPGVHVIALPVPQPTAAFGLPGIMRQDPDFIPGYVANYILGGGGFSSRLMGEVRVKRGLTYGISTSLTAYNKAAVMQGSVATRANAIRQTVQVVKDTLAEFRQERPHPAGTGRRQDLSHRQLPAGLRLQQRHGRAAGHLPAAESGYRLCRPPQFPDPGGDFGGRQTRGQTPVRSRAPDGGHRRQPGGGRPHHFASRDASGDPSAGCARDGSGHRACTGCHAAVKDGR